MTDVKDHGYSTSDEHDHPRFCDAGQAMKPAATAPEKLKPNHQSIQTPPIRAGSDSITINVPVGPEI